MLSDARPYAASVKATCLVRPLSLGSRFTATFCDYRLNPH